MVLDGIGDDWRHQCLKKQWEELGSCSRVLTGINIS
ncbi:unnamed protein product [Brassica rapa subsp. narinosa]